VKRPLAQIHHVRHKLLLYTHTFCRDTAAALELMALCACPRLCPMQVDLRRR
jgi:hypothetical protein